MKGGLQREMLIPIYNTRLVESGLKIDPETGELTLWVAKNRGAPNTQGAIAEVVDPFPKGYGTYEYDIQINVHDENTIFYFGFIEEAPSDADNGIIFRWEKSFNYQFWTIKDGVGTQTGNIEGVDLRTKGRIKLVWNADSARLYVNGGLKAEHNTNIPTVKGVLFAEIHRPMATENRLMMKIENNFGRKIL